MAVKLKGIDVSSHQGKIDWIKVKPNIDFAILRCGYGGDIKSQDDSRYSYNVSECERLGIPFAVYLYSYATTTARVDSEIAHTKRLLKGHKPFCVYIDMEDKSTVSLGKTTLTSFAKRYCEAMKSAGYKAGVYANQNWFQNYLDVKALHKAGYSIWCAKYSSNEPNIAAPYDLWQYSSSGKMNGITSGGLDMNYMYNDIRSVTVKKPAVKKAYSKAFPVLPSRGYLKKGDNGTEVKKLQEFLNWYGNYKLVVDGVFGVKTDEAVRKFQKAEKLVVDGLFGKNSLAKAKSIKK